jgi:hypothetical protein
MNSSYDRNENAQLRFIIAYAKSKKFPLYVVTNTREVIPQFGEATKDSAVTFMCDAVAIKTAARANPTLYLLKDGTIQNKWAYADLKKAYEHLHEIK